MKYLGIPFSEQTPESFHNYAKEVHKHMNIKKPEAIKTKTRKKTKNGKHDDNTGSEPSVKRTRKTKKDVENIQNGGWQA